MMLAWFSSSETMWSSGPRMAETVPALAAKPGLKNHAGFDILERARSAPRADVQPHGAGDGPYGARADAEIAHRLERRLAQFRMSGQAEVIVGGEIDDLLPSKRDSAALSDSSTRSR